jgi:hypothetical protein
MSTAQWVSISLAYLTNRLLRTRAFCLYFFTIRILSRCCAPSSIQIRIKFLYCTHKSSFVDLYDQTLISTASFLLSSRPRERIVCKVFSHRRALLLSWKPHCYNMVRCLVFFQSFHGKIEAERKKRTQKKGQITTQKLLKCVTFAFTAAISRNSVTTNLLNEHHFVDGVMNVINTGWNFVFNSCYRAE